MLPTWFDTLLWVLAIATALYTAVLVTVTTSLIIAGWIGTRAEVKLRALRDYSELGMSSLSTPVSILVPAYNEEATIIESVRSLLQSSMSDMEVVVISDGSHDATVSKLVNVFELVQFPVVPQQGLQTEQITAVYSGGSDERLIVVDKINGGKADAINAGLNIASYPLVCVVDADTLLEPESLAAMVWEYEVHPETVAVGGTIGIANEAQTKNASIVDRRVPRRLLPRMQQVEYARAFLAARVGWSRWKMLIIISGAFGLFHRRTLIAAGGYRVGTVGEDAEIVVRLHQYCRDNDRDYRIVFVPNPVAWTEVPSRWRVWRRQRDRWQRGLAETLWIHRRMIARRPYGRIGWFALPYFWIFELFAPVVEVTGYIIIPVAAYFGFLSWPFALILAVALILLGIVWTLTAVALEQAAFGQDYRGRDVWRLLVASFVENLGYRQASAVVRLLALPRVLWVSSWGTMERTGFTHDTDSPDEDEPAPRGA